MENSAEKLLDLFVSDDDGRYSFRSEVIGESELCKLISEPMHRLTNNMSEDMVYAEVVDALTAIMEDGLEAVEENIYEYTEASIYTSDLLQWLASRPDHVDYVDEALGEFGSATSIVELISYGQSMAKREVWYAAIETVRELAEEVE